MVMLDIRSVLAEWSLPLRVGAAGCVALIGRTPRGQIEAARSLAMTDLQIFLCIVLPSVLGRCWPGMVSRSVVVLLGPRQVFGRVLERTFQRAR
ncbi:hypothetical protein [Sphaerotilus sp.]|uniref:hypothetical protein n=1 Tax=Sphaerotilus sp. TaxID=2093942 RepID=UPI0034E27C0F